MPERPVLLWLRLELRLDDHPALLAASASGRAVIPVYVLDEQTPGRWAPGGASRWWLGTSLPRLYRELRNAGSGLVIRVGEGVEEITRLAADTGAAAVYLTRNHEPWARESERRLHERLTADGLEVHRYPGALLAEPEAVATRAGAPFRVFTPFARAIEALPALRTPNPAPARIPAPARWPQSVSLASLGLMPTKPDWAAGLRETWTPGENGAMARLDAFLDGPLRSYATQRDRPDVNATSRLSPHLHFGEISVATCWQAVDRKARQSPAFAAGVAKFRRELLWREFSYHLLHANPTLPEAPLRPEFAAFPWAPPDAALEAWQRGTTGYPIVDAGMRQLWQTGYMHNRVRMIVASFLVKDLLIDWQQGERWFWDTLVDADLANNAASWQWVAGCGADGAPYFRIFNPVKQGETFDPEGTYVRAFVPELAALPARHIHAPFAATEAELAAAGVVLGQTYPRPIVDHQVARRIALESFGKLKRG